MKVQLKKRYVGIGAAVAALLLGAGTAWAVWTVTGSGSAGGAATIAQSITVQAVTPSGSGAVLWPGGPAGQVYVNLTNPNPFAVTITGYQWGTPVSLNTTSCPNANIVLDAGAPTTASLALAANQTLSGVQINGVLDLLHSAPNGCQGVGFSVPLTVTGTQQ